MVPVQDLAVLGLLMDAPLHGYELKHRIAERMRHVVRIPPGTVYYTLKKLSQQGYVESERERAGNRPEREVFRLTELGRARFRELAELAISVDERATWAFDVALYFLPLLDRARFSEAVATKRARITAFRRDVDDLSRAFPGQWPSHLEALRRKGEILSDALSAWYAELGALLDDEKTVGTRAIGRTRARGDTTPSINARPMRPRATASAKKKTPQTDVTRGGARRRTKTAR